MPSKDKYMQVACVVMTNGDTAFVPQDRAAIQTVVKQWRKSGPQKWREKYQDKKLIGGVVIITMLATDFHEMEPRLSWERDGH
ncbi:MAG: hypothetical protein V3S69_05865 [Dehalococcoidales bacterium]